MRDAMFGLSDEFPQVVEINLGQIRPNPNQPRRTIDEGSLAALASSIEQHGLVQPIVVKEAASGYLLVAGQRRWLAHQRLGRETIFAIVTQGDADEIALVENLQREALDPLEEAEAMARLLERHGYTQTRLGQVLGRRQSTISEILRLTTLPEDIKAAYQASDIATVGSGAAGRGAGKVAKAVLIELARIKDPAEQRRLWAELRQGGTLRQIRARKKAARAVRSERHPEGISRVVSSGQSFVRRLERLAPEDLGADRQQRALLLALKERIDRLIDRYTAGEVAAGTAGEVDDDRPG